MSNIFDGSYGYEQRIPDSADSRHYSLIPLVSGLVGTGIGALLAKASAQQTGWASNWSVWGCLGLMLFCTAISLSMLVSRWTWTSRKMGLFAFATLGPLWWAFQGVVPLALLVHSDTVLPLSVGLVLLVLTVHGWWAFQVWKRCHQVWMHVDWRTVVWERRETSIFYHQEAAKAVLEAVGMRWHPGVISMLLPFAMVVPMFVYRHELVAYGHVPLMPLACVVVGLSAFLLITSALAMVAAMMVAIPAKVSEETGLPVVVDMMSKFKSPARSGKKR